MEPIEQFKAIRDASDEVVKALESEDKSATEAALGKFIILMLKLDAVK